MNILQIVDVRWWNASAYYGVTISHGLARNGHRVAVVGINGTPPVEYAEKEGLKIYTMPLNRFGLTHLIGNAEKLGRIILEEGVEVVNAHRSEGHALAAAAIRRIKPRPVLIRTLGDSRPPKPHLLNSYLHRSLTDRFIASGECLKMGYVERMGISPGMISVIRGGIDLARFKGSVRSGTLREKIGVGRETPVVGIVARLSPEKGHRDFLEAASIVNRSFPEAVFLIAGEEKQIKVRDLEISARRLGISEKVRFVGREQNIAGIMIDIDVGVIASVKSETICRVAMEFMALGVPLVGTDVNVIPELIDDGRTGFVVPPGDPLALARGIESILGDPGLAESFSSAAREKAEREFSLENFVSQTEEVIVEAMTLRPDGGYS